MGQHLAVVVLIATTIGSAQPGPATLRASLHPTEAACSQSVLLQPRRAMPELDLALSSVLRVAETRQNHGTINEALRRNAEELYKATSRDAESFSAALLIPEVRLKLERALHQKLSDQMLRQLATRSKLEALYWYKYMQGLERARSGAMIIEPPP